MSTIPGYDKASEQYENREPKWADEYSAQWKAYGVLPMAKKEMMCARFLDHVGGWELYSESTRGAGKRLVEYCGMLDSFTHWLDTQDVEEIW
jgi:hypothetical protein